MKKFLFIVISILLLFNTCTTSQIAEKQPAAVRNPMPADPQIIISTLENGLVYYIRENSRPENRSELWLALKAGSINEDDDQKGLAHLAEHMAFNGTDDFPKDEIVRYLESIGMKFGPEINAYTSFNQTVYMLQIPMDNPEFLEEGMHILSQWASAVSFDPVEIDKERGVVVEEWRMGRGAQRRLQEEHLPVIFSGSKYADRLPIGDMDIIENFEHETLINFYEDWYRPDLMSVIAVGDFDSASVEELIKKYFSPIENPENPRQMEEISVSSHSDIPVNIASDPEALYPVFEYYHKRPDFEIQDMEAYRGRINYWLIMDMINKRLSEFNEKPESGVLYSQFSEDMLVPGLRSSEIVWVPANDKIMEAGEAILTEYERLGRFGFTSLELERSKSELLSVFRTNYNERDNTESGYYLQKCLNNFLSGLELSSIEWKWNYIQQTLEQINPDEIKKHSEGLFEDENHVLLISIPESLENIVPEKEELLALIEKVKNSEVEAPKEEFTDLPFFEETPKQGKTISEEEIKDISAYKIVLENGLTVFCKPTDFKADEIHFTAFSPGGTSLVSEDDYLSSLIAVEIVTGSGLGDFSSSNLEKKLAGKLVSISPWISTLSEGFSGAAAKDDLETALQLIHLFFTRPRADQDAITTLMESVKAVYENRESDPGSFFSDQLNYLLHDNHPRYKPISKADIKDINPQTAYKIYKDRFANAGDFVFVFTGSFTMDEIRPLVETYLGSLPSTGEKEKWKDLDVHYTRGVQEQNIYKGKEEKSIVALNYTGDYEWESENNFYMNILESVLSIKLREIIREEESGTYGVRVSAYKSHFPDQEYNIHISFGCSPERAEELAAKTSEVLIQMKNGIEDDIISRVLEAERKNFEKGLKENSFWLNEIEYALFHDLPLSDIPDYEQVLDNFSKEKLIEVFKKYINPENVLKSILYPDENDAL